MDNSDFKNYENYPDPYDGEYRNMLNLLISKAWFCILYIVITVLLIYSLGYFISPLILFICCSIPTLLAIFYVLYPNQNIRYSLLITWISTSLFLILIDLLTNIKEQETLNNLGNFIGLLCWVFTIYCFLLGISWNISIVKNIQSNESNNFFWGMISRLMVIWGTTLQIGYFFTWFIIPYFSALPVESFFLNSFIDTIKMIYNLSITRFLPLGLILLGLLILGSLKFNTNPYSPISFDDVLKGEKNIFVNIILQAIRLPVWLIIIIIGFINHFTKLVIRSIGEIGYSYIARLVFLIVGLFVAPILFFIGHSLILISFYDLSDYLNHDLSFSLSQIVLFIKVNLIFIVGLCLYVIATPILSLKYRGENINELIYSIHTYLFTHGKTIAIATGRTFSLFGLVAFVVPIASVMPGGPSFGTFSLIYSLIILVTLGYYIYSKRK